MSSKQFFLSYVFNGFFKRTLKLFFFLLINQALVLEGIFRYLITCGYYQNHVDNNIILLRCNYHYLSPKHGLSYVLMGAIINIMFNEIVNETIINDGTKFVCFFVCFFVITFFCILLGCAKIPFIATSFLSLSLLFELLKFQWQCSLECLDLLH
jgi:hypothetical protein